MKFINKQLFSLVCISCGFFISGCSTNFRVTPPPGKDQTTYYAEKVECQKIASHQSSSAYVNRYAGSASSGQTINKEMFFDCLRGKGYKIDFQ